MVKQKQNSEMKLEATPKVSSLTVLHPALHKVVAKLHTQTLASSMKCHKGYWLNQLLMYQNA